MVSFQAQLLADFDRDIARGIRLVADDFVERVKADPATPRDTGALAKGIVADPPTVRPGRATTEVRSTTKTDGGGDLGTILDRSTGKEIVASNYGHQAFGPFKAPVRTASGGSTRFLAKVKLSTAHVGWWDKSTNERHVAAAANQLAKVDL